MDKEVITYLRSTLYELKERIKTANEKEIYAIGDTIYDITILIKELTQSEK